MMRVLIINSIAIVSALSYLGHYAKSFPSQLIPRRIARARCSSYCAGEDTDKRSVVFSGLPPLAALNDKNAHLDVKHESTDNWTMEEDWALIDNLPLFTVSTTIETKTFWTQLWHANPILFSTKQPEDLYQRTLELQHQRDVDVEEEKSTNQKHIEKNNGGGSDELLTFGISPPILENWKMDFEEQGNIMVGQIESTGGVGRRTVWFHYHAIGRLEGDPFADKYSSVVSLMSGGYIEAVGGRVYELGQPMLLEKWEKEKTSQMSNKKEQIDTVSDKGDDVSSTISRWWLPGSTAAVSALVSSTILSACIGYGAGLSIRQDESYHRQGAQPTPIMMSTSSYRYLKRLPQSSSSSTVTAATKSSTITTNTDPNQKPSTEELRARAQYRVLREQRLLKKISQQLELDKQYLQLDDQQQSSKLLP